jgi:hypothetical protein
VPRSITVGLSLARAGVWRAMTRPLLATLVALALAGCGATTRTITVAANTHTAATPILAEPWSSNQKGYGEVEPRTIFNGGDPTGLMREINWITWGGPVAVGEGLNIYVRPNQSVAERTPETALVALFQLGRCHGRVAYNAVKWPGSRRLMPRPRPDEYPTAWSYYQARRRWLRLRSCLRRRRSP